MALLLCFVRDYKIAFTVLTFGLCGFYGAVILFRLMSVTIALFWSGEHKISHEEVDALPEGDLPIYTVLVPMYKEPEVAQKIARAVTNLNYPIDKLDVKLLLEEDDAPTRKKIEEVFDSLPKCVEVIVCPSVPKGQPRTKPRACNWGLELARGKYLVVFDAEDQPERDQLKKAVIAFRRLEAKGKSHVACLQAKLNYFNARQNALTRFFTLEYTTWFDLFLPGLHAVRTPIPLGGTSNHFKTDVLKEIGGWDPFNVTEDCDLGMRLARKGCSTEILDSTTWEEANSHTGNWIRQRSRWIKGYFQTHLVHTRDSVVPVLLLSAGFFWLRQIFEKDLVPGTPENLANWIRMFSFISLVCGIAAAGSALISILNRLRHRFSGNTEGQLNLYQAATFRFTVGGLSLMLLLNIVFWTMTATYLLREPIANVMPNAVARIKLDETTTVKEALLGWKLYYTNVVDETNYSNVTFWNTIGNTKLNWNEKKERIAAVDTWSLVSQLFFPVAITLFVANIIFVLLGMVSCHKRRLWDLFPFALPGAFYWVLISIAAVKGFWQLFFNPWYWEKTTHGLSQSPPPAQPPVEHSEALSSAAGE